MKKLTAFVMAIVLSLSCISEVYALEVTAAAENTEANTEEAGSSEGGTAFEDTDDAPGSQDESYTVTRQGKRGIASGWLVAWPGSFRMEALRRLKNEKHAASLWS